MHDAPFIVFSFIGVFLVGITLPVLYRNRNFPAFINGIWLGCVTFCCAVNAIVWWDNIDNHAPVWGDITVHIQACIRNAVAICGLLINVRLAYIATGQKLSPRGPRQRLITILEIALSAGLPPFLLILGYVVQPHRYDIREGYGPTVLYWPCLAYFFLVEIWPLTFSLLSSIAGIIAINCFLRQRLQFQALLRNSSSGINSSQYLRLFALSCTDLLLTLPFSLWDVGVLFRDGIVPFGSWDSLHADWLRYDSFWAVEASDSGPGWLQASTREQLAQFLLNLWILPMACVLMFLFFGLSEDGIRNWMNWATSITDKLHPRRKRSLDRTLMPNLGSKSVTIDHSYGRQDSMVDYKDPAAFDDTEMASPIHGQLRGASGISVTVERSIV